MTGVVLASAKWLPLLLAPIALVAWAALFWVLYRLSTYFGRRHHRQPPA